MAVVVPAAGGAVAIGALLGAGLTALACFIVLYGLLKGYEFTLGALLTGLASKVRGVRWIGGKLADVLESIDCFPNLVRTGGVHLMGATLCNRRVVVINLTGYFFLRSAGDRLTSALLALHARRQQMADRQRHLAERFTAAHPGVPATTVPALAEDVHDLDGLREIGGLIAAS